MREALAYGTFLLYSKVIDIIPSGPFFKVYHWEEMYRHEEENGMYDLERLIHNYHGVVLQSNWS